MFTCIHIFCSTPGSGFVHITQIADNFIEDIHQEVEEGQEVQAQILPALPIHPGSVTR